MSIICYIMYTSAIPNNLSYLHILNMALISYHWKSCESVNPFVDMQCTILIAIISCNQA